MASTTRSVRLSSHAAERGAQKHRRGLLVNKWVHRHAGAWHLEAGGNLRAEAGARSDGPVPYPIEPVFVSRRASTSGSQNPLCLL